MPADVPPPTHVLTLVLLSWAAGSVVIGAWTQTWSEIQAGHFKVIWLVSTALFVAAGFGYAPAWIVAAVCALTFLSIYRGLASRLGFVAAAAALVALVKYGPIEGAASAVLLGAVTNAMLLGHWHLNQPRLGTKPIARLVIALWVGVGVYAATMGTRLALGTTGVGGLGAIVALAFTVFAGILTAPVHHLVRTRSIMSATGILYLEILLCLVAAFTGSLAALARA